MADISRLHWMQGCWSSDGEEAGSIEQWMTPAGQSMLGMNRRIRDGKTAAFEFMRIFETDDKMLIFSAAPSGQKATDFALLHQSQTSVVFENPGHDFPQRVAYRITSSGKLIGHIEGTIDGEFREIDFPMTRTNCTDESIESSTQ